MRWILLLCVISMFSCNNSEKTEVAETEGQAPMIAETEAEKDKTVTNSKIPVYDFEALAPLLQKNNDTTYVVNFWATWCKPCIKELPYFEKVNKEYAQDRVKVILVSLDFPDILEEQVIPFVEKRQIESQVVLLDDPDANGWIPKVDPEWSGAIPATIIYNRDNRKFYEKSFTQEELENEIKSIL